MRKVMSLFMVMILMFVIAACVEIQVSDVVGIELINWVPEERYEQGETVDLSNAQILVSFEGDTEDQTFLLSAEDVTLTGTGSLNAQNELVTSSVGDFNIKISYGGVTVTVNYSIVEHLVRPGESIQDEIDTADVGDTVYLAPGTYALSTVLTVNQAISLVGSIDASGEATTIIKGNPATDMRAMNIETFVGDVTIQDIVFIDFGKNNNGPNQVFSIYPGYDGTVVFDHVTVKDFSKVAIIASDGVFVFRNSTIDGARATGSNSAPTGIQAQYDVELHIIDSVFKNTVSTTDQWSAVAVNILNGGTLKELRGTTFEGNEFNIYIGNEYDWTGYGYPTWGEISDDIVISGNTHDGSALIYSSTFVMVSGSDYYPDSFDMSLAKTLSYQGIIGENASFGAYIRNKTGNDVVIDTSITMRANMTLVMDKKLSITENGSLILEAGASLELWYFNSANLVVEGTFTYAAYYYDEYGDPVFVGSVDDVPDGTDSFASGTGPLYID